MGEIIDASTDYLPLMNFLFMFVLVPLWRLGSAMQKSVKNQQEEIRQLKQMAHAHMAVTLKFLPPEASQLYIKEMGKNEHC